MTTEEKKRNYRESHQRWRLANPDKVRASGKRCRERRKEASRARAKFRHKNDPEYREAKRTRSKRATARLSDGYIRRKLSRDSVVPRSAWPQELVDLKRVQLQLNRKAQS